MFHEVKITELETNNDKSTDIWTKEKKKKKHSYQEEDHEEQAEKEETNTERQMVVHSKCFSNAIAEMAIGWNPMRNLKTEILDVRCKRQNYPSNQLQLCQNLHHIVHERRSEILFVFSDEIDNNVALLKSKFCSFYDNFLAEFGLNNPNMSIGLSLDLGPSDDLTLLLMLHEGNYFLSAKFHEYLYYQKIEKGVVSSSVLTYPDLRSAQTDTYSCRKSEIVSFFPKNYFSNLTFNMLKTIFLNHICFLGGKGKVEGKGLEKDHNLPLKLNCFLLVNLLLLASDLSGKTNPFCLDSVSDETREAFCCCGEIVHNCLMKDATFFEDKIDHTNISRSCMEVGPENILEYLCAFRLAYLYKTERGTFCKALSELKHIRNGITFPLSARMIHSKEEEAWDPSLFMCYYSVYGKDELPSWLQQKTPRFKMINAKVNADGQVYVRPHFTSQQEKELFELIIINGHLKKLCFKETMQKADGMCLLEESIPLTENLPIFHLTTFTNGFCESFLKDLSLSELILSFSILEDNDIEAIAKAVQSSLSSLTLIDCELEGCWGDFLKQILGENSKLTKLNIACEGFADAEIESISEILGKSESLKNLTIACDEIHSMNWLKFCQDGKKKWESVELTNFILFIPENSELEDITFTVSSLALFGKSESLQKSAKALSLCSIESLVCHGSFLQEMTKFSEWHSFHTIRELKIIDSDLKVITSLIDNFVKLDKFRWGISEGVNTVKEIARQWACVFEKRKQSKSKEKKDCTLFLLLGFSEDNVEPNDFIRIIKQITQTLITRLKDENEENIQILEISISQEWGIENLKEFLKTVKDLVLLLQNKAIRQLKVDLIGYSYWKKPIQIKDVQIVFPSNQFQTEFKEKEGSICDSAEIVINALQ